MRLEIKRHSLQLIPEGEVDEAYLEEVLGLHDQSRTAEVRRRNAHGLSCWAYAEVLSVPRMDNPQEVRDE